MIDEELNEGDRVRIRTKRNRLKGVVIFDKMNIIYLRTFSDKYYLIDKKEIIKLEKF